ncbi:bifunctional indole-3-glycerol-phosphate synthase TrpC/phosphoribosylanthranilate isomerase TrpF [Celerinatantimonas diazotrophica]|uniref:Multifunctional fusion protein n=1 Tax=Celerinatantimonas diazotrophica TaxID=412034 RepID=A0A4R1JAK1_9GAMM|nr:bifunctional indole-3-glycerol-phosphate synthase TrpC/phosphoribosylanthranilate isomerase TrpF [Celerinatantimonas diazotrophica]TCK47524.1 indole-3-glycerol phosphate synthase [Celerinatantimonas diazotrophica]CAG9296858.1 Tryptophan biosynthesis protein TrpCF [Celerinatantimonas diazotrophica]
MIIRETGTILDKIVADKIKWVEQRKLSQPLASFKDELTISDRSFIKALSQSDTQFILECKKASPSKGQIREEFDLAAIASVYNNHAAAISVLTDEKYFQGNHEFLLTVREHAHQPVLCKDFFIDPYQVYLARYYQADVILLMLSVLDDELYQTLAQTARSLGLDYLTEVSNQEELDRAIALDAPVIGINNRNLRDMSIDLTRTEHLAPQIPADRIVVSESGIYTNADVHRLSHLVNAFLVGSSIMEQTDIEMACRKMILGENKVCGLTRPADAIAAYEAGAVFGGLIFVERSPRFIELAQATAICKAAPLQFVGVFANASIEKIANIAEQLNLYAVQLHGNESDAEIANLRGLLPKGTQIWKAVGVSHRTPELPENVDRVLFDAQIADLCGGTGQTFNWQLVKEFLPKAMLAGGLGPNNVAKAATLGALGLDFNSQIESHPGIKEPALIQEVFTQLRHY